MVLDPASPWLVPALLSHHFPDAPPPPELPPPPEKLPPELELELDQLDVLDEPDPPSSLPPCLNVAALKKLSRGGKNQRASGKPRT
jgi:hypothetical protein